MKQQWFLLNDGASFSIQGGSSVNTSIGNIYSVANAEVGNILSLKMDSTDPDGLSGI